MSGSTLSVIERRQLAHLSLAAVLLVAGAVAVILYRFPPAVYSFYPLCPVHEYLHLECPGCGTTRALAALLHGRFREAMHLNALAVYMVIPAATAYGLFSYGCAVRGAGAFRWPQVPLPAIYTLAVLVAVFTVMRNL